MNKLRNLFLLTSVALAAVFSSGCGIDNPVEPLGPTLVLAPGVNAVVDSATVAPGEFFLVQLDANQGDEVITRIEVRENGSAIDPSRIVFDGDSAQSNPNPVDLAMNLDWGVEIQAGDAETTSEYTIVLTDQNGLTASAGVTITTVEPTTPVTVTEMVMLLNQAGPAGQGGLDIDSGTGTGTVREQDSVADIRDMGLKDQFPNNAENWRQQISAINNTTLKYIDPATQWEDIETLEDIVVAFDNGNEITDTSEVVAVGDVFLVESTRGILYALLVTDVNVTTDDNNDSYEFEVKGPQ